MDESLEGAGSRRDGQLLLDALTSLGAERLAQVLATVDLTRLLPAFRDAAERMLRKSELSAPREFREAVQRYAALPEPDLLLKTVEAFERLLGLAPGAAETAQAIEDRCEAIAHAAVLAAAGTIDGIDARSGLADLARAWALTLLASEGVAPEAAATFSEMDESEQEALVRRTQELIEGLPKEAQERFAAVSGVSDGSAEALRAALVSGAGAAGLSAAVGAAGFGAYAATASGLSALAGLVGLTLPFGAYAAVSSLLAVVSSPLVAPIVPAVMIARYVRRASSVDKRLASALVARAVLEAAATGAGPRREVAEEAARLWSAALDALRLADRELADAESALRQAKDRAAAARRMREAAVRAYQGLERFL